MQPVSGTEIKIVEYTGDFDFHQHIVLRPLKVCEHTCPVMMIFHIRMIGKVKRTRVKSFEGRYPFELWYRRMSTANDTFLPF